MTRLKKNLQWECGWYLRLQYLFWSCSICNRINLISKYNNIKNIDHEIYPKQKRIIHFFTFHTTFFTSCNSFFKGSMKDNGKQFPPDFGKPKTTILMVQAGKKSYDKYLIKNWKTYYAGDYVFVKREELNQKMYEDIKKYRYIFDDEENSHTSRNISTGRNQTLTGVLISYK